MTVDRHRRYQVAGRGDDATVSATGRTTDR